MRCDEFEQQLQLALDERREPRDNASLVAHAEHCAECERVLHVQSRLFASLSLIRSPSVSDGFSASVLQRFTVESRRAFRIRLAAWSLAAAAVILLCCLPWMAPSGGLAFSTRPNSGSSTLGLATIPPAGVHAPPRLNGAQTTTLSAEEVRNLVREFVTQLSDPRFSARESVNQLAVTIRPLAVTFNVAFDTLWRTLPGQSESDSNATKTSQFESAKVWFG